MKQTLCDRCNKGILLNAIATSEALMPLAKIHLITSTPIGILLVFYTDGGCWQFRVLSSGGAVFGEQKLYYTAEAAERAGRDWVSTCG